MGLFEGLNLGRIMMAITPLFTGNGAEVFPKLVKEFATDENIKAVAEMINTAVHDLEQKNSTGYTFYAQRVAAGMFIGITRLDYGSDRVAPYWGKYLHEITQADILMLIELIKNNGTTTGPALIGQ